MQSKKMKTAVTFLLGAGLLLPTAAHATTADNAGKALVHVRLVGVNGMTYDDYLQVGSESYTNTSGQTIQMHGPTALGALIDLLKAEGLTYQVKTSSVGSYVSKVGTVAEKQIDDNTGWGDWVNGQMPDVGGDQATVKTGDEVVWAFYDYSKTLYPSLRLSTQSPQVGDTFTITATAQQTTYDANWNPTTKTVPVDGATIVTDDGQKYVTDANGVATVKATHAGLFTYDLSKFDASGLALAIDSGKQAVLVGEPNAQFADLKGYGWAQNAIENLADKGIWAQSALGGFSDKGSATGVGANQIDPSQAVTREELAKFVVLSGQDLHIGGTADFSDLQAQDVLNPYIKTAVREGYMSGDADGMFRPSAPVTREELAIVATRLAGLQPGGAALNFADAKQVDRYALPYVQAAVQNKLLVGDENGNFHPHSNATFAEVAVVLNNILQQQAAK